jgi:hypothetical protein
MINIWILTEEMPKKAVIQTIVEKVTSDNNFLVNIKDLTITPILDKGLFTFTYKVNGVTSQNFSDIYIKIASGNSSFVDFLVFIQDKEPDQSSMPLYAIEETKTDDSESRNTGVYQRCSKFVYVEFYYPGIKKIMLYNLQIPQKDKPTQTNLFGTRMLKTIGVEILGKVYEEKLVPPFTSLEELIQVKNAMRMPPAGNVPIKIESHSDRITISGRLFKAGGLGHDPNIGALTIIALCIRKWEKKKDIVITHHGLIQAQIGSNKFVQIANRLDIKLDGLIMPVAPSHEQYWHFELSQEKMASIFLHVSLLAYTNATIIYANHGGSERGYFIHKTLGPGAVAKYQEGKKLLYKAGDKTVIIHLPDMVIYDVDRNQVINVEGKKYTTRNKGIEELNNFDYIEQRLISPSYNPSGIVRTVVVFGSKEVSLAEPQIGFMLNVNGKMVLGSDAPEIFKEVVEKILSHKNV